MSKKRFYRSIFLSTILGLFTVAAFAQDYPVGHQPDEQEAVLKAVDDFIITLTSQDLNRRSELQTTDGMTYTAVHRPDGTWRVVGRPNSFFLDPKGISSNESIEKFWAPVVMIRGPLAMVWNPFEFWLDGKTSHCGINLMQLVKTEGEWKLANTMWTHEPTACEALRPSDLSTMRPN